MKRIRSMLTLLAIAAAIAVLSSCNLDCPSCGSLSQPTPTPQAESFAFTLCVSEVPVFASQEGRGCGEVTVEFVTAVP
jgi:hypothetical protein